VIRFDPQIVKNSLTDLLSGSPIIIDKTNFTLFQNVYESLGNQAFELCFGKIHSNTPTKFFLSIHALKGIVEINSHLVKLLNKMNFTIFN
jgi:hypothetical protein